jgi:hypothetical protein
MAAAGCLQPWRMFIGRKRCYTQRLAAWLGFQVVIIPEFPWLAWVDVCSIAGVSAVDTLGRFTRSCIVRARQHVSMRGIGCPRSPATLSWIEAAVAASRSPAQRPLALGAEACSSIVCKPSGL